MQKKKNGILCCLLTAVIWGTAFVVQDKAAELIPPFTFLTARSFVGAIALLPLMFYRNHAAKKEAATAAGGQDFVSCDEKTKTRKAGMKKLIFSGFLCGFFLCAASALQQMGIGNNTGSPGKDAFITALYIVFVPLIGFFFGRRSPLRVYACVLVALGGLYLLCMQGSHLTVGDIQLIACSFLFACQMMVVDRVAPGFDAVQLSFVQFLSCGVLSFFPAVFAEGLPLTGLLSGWWTVAYAGLISNGVAYTLQIIGQQRLSATASGLLLSLESVAAVIASMVLLHKTPTLLEFAGMILIFTAVVVAQLPAAPHGKKPDIRNSSSKKD